MQSDLIFSNDIVAGLDQVHSFILNNDIHSDVIFYNPFDEFTPPSTYRHAVPPAQNASIVGITLDTVTVQYYKKAFQVFVPFLTTDCYLGTIYVCENK
jgi:hypothetical protein